MKQYIGTKMVQAAPAIRFLLKSGENMIVEKDDMHAMQYAEAMIESGEVTAWEEAYTVVYKDGYSSWSPAQVFEEAYRETSGMNFGLAIEAAKMGKKIARAGWNGKGMFLYYVPAAAYPPATDVAKEAFDGQNVPYGAYIAMKTAQGNVVPWLASQTDMLADDWYIVEG